MPLAPVATNGQQPEPWRRTAPAKPPVRTNTTAARLAAADRGRTTAQTYRSKPTSAEAIRAKVRAEMKQESEACKQRTLAKLEQEEEIAREDKQVREEKRQAVRSEARRVYADELREQEHNARPPPTSEPAPAPAAEPEESAASRIAALMHERAERRLRDAEEVNALRERVAARRPDRERWGPASDATPAVATAAAKATLPERRSLFTWQPPAATPAAAAGAPPAPAGAKNSHAAQEAWNWVKQPTPAPEGEGSGSASPPELS